MEDVFGPGGLLERHHPNYEYRPGQIEMAQIVLETIEKGGVSLIEAGTGTGKTLAYLIPALAAGRRVIVSTATKALQEQLHKKDVPFLQKVIPREFTATCMKGRANYLCLYRLKKADQTPILQGFEEIDHFEHVRKWSATTETGDRAELSELPENLPFWHQIDARADTCLGQKCPDFDSCFITRMRQRALESDVVIVNHHLFFADLALRGDEYGSVLPDYSTVIFDEAHELEDVAASYFGLSASSPRVMDLIQDVQKLPPGEAEESSQLAKSIARLSRRSDLFFLSLAGESDPTATRPGSGAPDSRSVLRSSLFFKSSREETVSPTALGEAFLNLSNALGQLQASLRLIKDPSPEVENLVRRTEALKFDLEFIVAAADPKFVYWTEKRNKAVFLHATPIDVSGILSESLFSSIHSAVLTSATMTTNESFEFIKSRLGIRHSRGLVIDTHFDFESQAVLYLPERLPDPRSSDYLRVSADEIERILEATDGRAFVLFTSVAAMRESYELLRGRLPFPTLIQGQGSKTRLLEQFRATKGSVLFATSSFWQGVDVQGDALSCVIISKLPFAVPSDPVVAARQRYIDDNGGNSFYEYSVPEAIIALKQGLGRLIRSKTDRGVMAILDPRLRTKMYGKLFLRSLPTCTVTNNLREAARVLAKAP